MDEVPMASVPVGLACPGCGEAPIWLLGGGTQAWCGTDDCPILTWNPTKTRAELNAEGRVIDLSPGNTPKTAGPGQDGPGQEGR